MKKWKLNKTIFLERVFTTTLFVIILLLFASINISNVTRNIFILKLSLIFSFFFLYQVEKKSFPKLKNFKFHDTKYFVFYLVLVVISFLSLFFTTYSRYGALKLLNIIFNLPILFIFKLYFESITYKNLKTILIILAIIIIVSFFILILANPFIQIETYSFKVTRWSHVIFSRVFSFMFLFLFSIFFYVNERKTLVLISIIIPIVLFEIYFASLRAATLGIIIFVVTSLFYIYKNRIVSQKKINLLIVSFIIFIALFFVVKTNSVVENRYEQVFNIGTDKLQENDGINARFIAYEKSIPIIKNNWLLGIGLGAFKGYGNDEYLDWIKYPHNMFLEFQVELGIFGSLFFLFYLVITFVKLKNISFQLLLIWLFALWLAMFAKDIPSNLIVFIPLIFYGKPYDKDKLKEFFAPNKNDGVLSINSSDISE